MCVGCKQRRRKAELIRFVRRAEGVMIADRCAEGRGFYLCPDRKCLRMAQRRRQTEDLGGPWESMFPDRTFFSEGKSDLEEERE